MSVLSDYVFGTITLTNGSINFTGTGTAWLSSKFGEGDTIFDVPGATEYEGVIASITAEGAGTLTQAWEGPTRTNVAYRMRFQSDGSRATAQGAMLRQLLGSGNNLALGGLVGSANMFPMFDGPGSLTLVARSSLVNGAFYNVQVNTLAGRAAYDGFPGPVGTTPGYAVFVANIGDGRAAIYSKLSDTSADWSAPGYVTGPVGPNPTITVDTTTTLAPGTPATVVATPVSGGIELDFGIPAGEGFISRGAYSGATAYAKGDVVLNNNSSWIAKIATTGNAPPTLPTTSNTQWQLLAAKGTDGTGTGDVVGPAGAVADRIAVFNGTTGKLIKDGGKTIAELVPTGYDDLLISSSLIALQVADNSNAALFLGLSGNQIADSFKALTYVDVAGATNLDTSVSGLLKPTSSATTDTIDTKNNNAVFSGYSMVSRATALVAGRVITKVGLYSDLVGTYEVSIVQRTAANAYTIVAGPVAISHPGGGTWVDAALPYTVPGTGTFYLMGYSALSGSHATTNNTARAWFSGHPTSGSFTTGGEDVADHFPMRYQHSLAVNSLTVRSASFTALAVPTKMKALLRVKEVDAAVAGTDYTIECSRDGGTTWTAMTLTELFTSPSPVAGIQVVQSAEMSVAGQPSGTAPRWRFKTLNSKIVELHDVSFTWS